MIKGIGHVGILVNDADAAANLYCQLFGLEKPCEIKEYPDQGMKGCSIKVGSQAFEIMEPMAGSPLARFVQQHGAGLHHVNLVVSDIKSLCDSLKERGVVLIQEESQFAFIHPKSTKGVLIELMQLNDSTP